MCVLLALPSILHPQLGIAERHIQLVYPSQHLSFTRGCVYYELLNEETQHRSKLVEAFLKAVAKAVPNYAMGFHGQHSDELGLVDAERVKGRTNCSLIFPAEKYCGRTADFAGYLLNPINHILAAQECVLCVNVSPGLLQ
jgi:hypothetical protein